MPSDTNPSIQFDGGMIVLAHTGYGGASLYMNIPTTHSKTQDYDNELSILFSKIVTQASKLRTGNIVSTNQVDWILNFTHLKF